MANAHTFFKVFQVIILFPFAKWIVKLTYLFVPDKAVREKQEGFQLEYIGPASVFSPNTAVVEVTKELERMGHIAVENLIKAVNVLIKPEDKIIEEVYETEQQINYMNHAITDYLVKISQSTLPIDDMKNIGGLFHVVNDIERIEITQKMLLTQQCCEKKKTFPSAKKQKQSFWKCFIGLLKSPIIPLICFLITVRSICRKFWI